MTAQTGAVRENVLFAFSLPASVISALQTLSFLRTLLCQLFFIIVQELKDTSRTAVYRDSLPQSRLSFPLTPLLMDSCSGNSLEGTLGGV